jgi:hypothetical protein
MTLGQKRFVLAAKTHLRWRVQQSCGSTNDYLCWRVLACRAQWIFKISSKSAHKSRTFSRKSRDAPRLPPSREASSTTTPHTHEEREKGVRKNN